MVSSWAAAIAWLGDNPGKVETEEGTVYRPKNQFLVQGITCTAIFGAMGVASFIAAWWNIDGSFPNPRTIAVVFAGGWSAFTSLGLYMIAHHRRARLRIGRDDVERQGCFLTRGLRFDDVSSARWRVRPVGGSLVLRGNRRKLVVEFADYSRSDRTEMIAVFRQRLPLESQTGWEAFALQFGDGLPLTHRRELITPETIRAQGRFLLRAALFFCACYLLLLIPVPAGSIVQGLIAGCFATMLIFNPCLAAMATIESIRFGNRQHIVAAALSLLLTVVSWWHAFHGMSARLTR